MAIMRMAVIFLLVAISLLIGCVRHYDTDLILPQTGPQISTGTFIEIEGERYELPLVLVSEFLVVQSSNGHGRAIGHGWELGDQSGKPLIVEELNVAKIYLRKSPHGWKYRVKGTLAELLVRLAQQAAEKEDSEGE